MNFIGYIYLRAGLFVFFFAVSSPLVIGLGLLWKSFIESHQSLATFDFLIVFPVLVWLLITNWLAREVANNITFEHMSFGQAFKAAYNDGRFLLAFVPFISQWFIRRGDKHKIDPNP